MAYSANTCSAPMTRSFDQWFFNHSQCKWAWDKPEHDGLRENRYFVEKIGGPVTERDNWYARAWAGR